MTIKEAQYFKKYIDGRLNDILGAMTQQQLNTLQGQRFAARFMGDIKGQQMLPQSVFRQFLNEIDFSEAKQLYDDLVKAQGQIEQALQQAEQVSDMNSLHYTDVGGEETPFYIYIDMDDPELAGIEADDETALWQGIDRILQAKRTSNIQIVDLNINHRGLHECSYLYFSTSVIKSNRRKEHEYLWSAEGYYSRVVTQNGVTGEWEWRDTYADIAAAYTLAHNNEQRLDAVEGTANEANQRSKDNLTRLDSVEGTANATKALADVHTTRLNKVEGVANEANIRSQNNMKRLDRVEGVANGAQALANNHTELINNVEATANEAKALAGKQRLTLSSIVYLNDLSESQTGVYLLDIVPSSKAAVSYLLVYQADEQGKLYQTLTNGTERKTRTKEKGGEWTGWTIIYYANASDVTKLQMDMQDIKTRIEALESKVNTNQSADNA